jgi:dipeptidyl aminopeptidase/acylaminoacyl peptidase
MTAPMRTRRYIWLVVPLLMLLVASSLAATAAAQDGDSPRLTVVAQALNVRQGPGLNYPAFDIVQQGDQLPVSGYDPIRDWWQVRLPDGNSGWVSGGASYISVVGNTMAQTPVASVGTNGAIVFQTASGGPIYAIDSDGSKLRQLTTGLDPALSPDGRWVAFARWDDVQHGAWGSLWVINIDGSRERAILGEIHQPKSPAWSADGTQIILSIQHGGRVRPERKCGTQRPPREAYDIDLDLEDDGNIKFCYTLPPHPFWGLRRVDIASGEFEDLPHDLFSYSPSWDPANTWRLVYDGERGLMNLDLNLGTSWSLTGDVGDHSPVFSPDGRLIAVSYKQFDHWEIHLLNADGSGRVRLTETPLTVKVAQLLAGETPRAWNNVAPTWSPDGSQLAFLTDRTGQWEIWVMNADGSGQRPLFGPETLAGISLQYNSVDERVLSWR